ncbi:response regulator [Geobacter pelophilus]|uniref:Response regulator n=1 Tax=Geoanaerobacter pelophilus TaxID=60036 RepID=A0AAW4L4B5_9BACT|nr:response regulator [Geoanaerobacter pelophilus]MBT0663081.1 response regulator [Geoanaerobacter pelophilus]
MKCVLVVDDDRDYLSLFGNFLLQAGFSVQCATSGDEALSILKDSTIHLMITDLNMPKMSGIELAKKALIIMPRMPIILHSGSISPELTLLAEVVGISRVMAKPVNPGAMLEAIRNEIREV